jgi:DNA-binding NarL/FixJ family response regulator
LQTQLTSRDVEIVGRARNLEETREDWNDAEADVLLVDARGESAGDLLEELRESGLPAQLAVVLLLQDSSAELVARALRAGVRAVLPAGGTPDELRAALQGASSGLIILHPDAMDIVLPLAEGRGVMTAENVEALTPREHEVLQMLTSGLLNKQIAARLKISEHTAKFHVASILGKLGAGTRAEAVAIGVRRGLVLL